MSNRLTLRISVILLALGIGLTPTAYLINGYMQDQVNAEIPRTFLIIRQGFADYLEVNFIGLGIPDVMSKIRNQPIPSLEDERIYNFLYTLNTIPHFLPLIKNDMVEKLPVMINGSRTALFINQTITDVMEAYSLTEAQVRALFFNNYQFENLYVSPLPTNRSTPSIEGISEYGLGTISLNFTGIARAMILDGDDDYPGILQDLTYGSGVLDWLEFYDLAKANIGNNRTEMETVYDCTWSSGKLQNVSHYIKNYMWDTIIKSLYYPKTLETYALETFYGQWANYSFYNNPVNLRRFIDPLMINLAGIEVVPSSVNPSGISLTACESLWDVSNLLSFVNQSGLIKWFYAYKGHEDSLNELTSTFGLNEDQFEDITTWLFDLDVTVSLIDDVIRILVQLPKPFGFGTISVTHTDNLFYEQWANGTIVKGGLNLNLAGSLKGFEVGVPTRTNISRSIAKSFFAVNNISSFMSKIGIFKWVQAEQGNISAQTELMNMFDLNLPQLNLLLDWLFTAFKNDVVPYLVLPLTGKTLNRLAFNEFPRQWAYGKYSETSIDLTNYTSTGFSFLGWELGIPTDLTLNLTQISDLSVSLSAKYPTLGLLDPSNSYSFANRKGISLWLKSTEIKEYYDNIIDEFSLGENNWSKPLTNAEYTQIYTYILYLKQNYVIPLLNQELIFGTDLYILSEMYQTGVFIGALIIIAAGIIFGVLGFLRKKR